MRTGRYSSRLVPSQAPVKVAIIITGTHCQWIPIKEPTVIAPMAFQIVATKIMVCMMAFFSSRPNTPAKVRVENRPAPEDKEPENKPTRKINTAPIIFLCRERCSIVLAPNDFLNRV